MKGRKATAIMAVLGIFGFWLFTKTLNYISKDAGAVAYQDHCGSCHGKKGEGFKQLVPPLANTDWIDEHMDKVPCVIMHGIKDSILVNGVWYNEEMLPLNHLTEVQVLNITNYIGKRFAREKTFYSQKELKVLLDNCE